MAEPVRDQILTAIGTTNSPELKTVLLLLLAVLEDIGGKLDMMRNDEKGLREAVLNGHQDVHHAHHEWISGKMQEEINDAAAEKASHRKIRDGLIEKAVWVALVAVAGSGWWIK